jgi:hypothetical protein
MGFDIMSLDIQSFVMKMIKQAVFTFLAVMTAAIVAGCGPLALSGNAKAAGANSAITSADQQPAKPQATPYSQPLMATGGDLVMLRVRSPGIAG